MDRWRDNLNTALAWGFLLAPIAAYFLVKSGVVEGEPFIGALLAVLGMIFLLIVKTAVFGVIEYVHDRRRMRRQLGDPAASRLLGKPDAAHIVVGAFLLCGRLGLLLFAPTLVSQAENADARMYVGAGSFAMALWFQLVGLQRIGDYFHARRAWRESSGN